MWANLELVSSADKQKFSGLSKEVIIRILFDCSYKWKLINGAVLEKNKYINKNMNPYNNIDIKTRVFNNNNKKGYLQYK